MKHRFCVLFAAFFLVSWGSLQAEDSACRPIVEANKAQWQAPTVHDRKVMDNGFTLETIKVGNVFYMKTRGAWRLMPPAMAKAVTDMAAIEKSGLQLKDCKPLGREIIGPMATRIYSFTVLPNSPQGSKSGKVWIGNDGLPYKMEGDKVKGTVVYTGVTAPTPGK